MALLDAEGWWPWLQGEGCRAAPGNELENAETEPDADSESKERPRSAQAATYFAEWAEAASAITSWAESLDWHSVAPASSDFLSSRRPSGMPPALPSMEQHKASHRV